MKKTKIFFVSIALLICSLFLCACPGFSDWTYTDLPGGYQIWHINSDCITVVRVFSEDSNDNESVIQEYVDAFCYNDTYIGIKRLPYDFDSDEYPDDVFEMDFSNLEHYIIDASTHEVHGPYTEEEYAVRCEELGVGEMCDWIKTYPKPEGAHL